MTEQTKQKLKYWLIGLFTGGAVAAPVTAVVCKNIYEKKIAEAIDQAETDGMMSMAQYAHEQQQQEAEKKTYSEPEPEEQPIEEEDYAEPTEYDTTIDEEDPEEREAIERTEAHQRYLDMIDKYKSDDVISPHIINGDQFLNEAFMTKTYVNWYTDDNVFEEDLNVIEDPYATLGVTNGRELFKNADLRPDPDICYVRNDRLTTDFEVSRIHGSYARMVGGEVNLGETDT